MTTVVASAPPQHWIFSVEFATAVPVSVSESSAFSTMLAITGAAGAWVFAAFDGAVVLNVFDAALVPTDVVSVAVSACAPAARICVVKLHEPLLPATVVPRALVPPSVTVTVAPAIAVPVRVIESLAFRTP